MSILKRVQKLEDLMRPESKGMTLEQACRLLWRKDKKRFLEIAKGTNYQLFVYRFQAEDAEAASKARRRPGVRLFTWIVGPVAGHRFVERWSLPSARASCPSVRTTTLDSSPPLRQVHPGGVLRLANISSFHLMGNRKDRSCACA